jgi:hypothetical protein
VVGEKWGAQQARNKSGFNAPDATLVLVLENPLADNLGW